MTNLTGQTAVVTGAGRGIGRAIATALARDDARVVCLARTESQLAETVAQIESLGGKASYRTLDTTDRDGVEAAVASIVDQHGRIDLWVNNAGRLQSIGPVWEADPDSWWQDVTTNLYGTYLCTRAAVRVMRRPEQADHGGRIVNIAGGGTMAPLRFASAYGSSKAAVARFTESLAWELKGTKVTTFAVNPGFVRTELTEHQLSSEAGRRYMGYTQRMFERGRDVPPDEAGRVVCFLASGRADDLSGRIFDVHVDLEHMVRSAEEIIRQDRHVLRLPKEP